ncbi:MAG TPA: hypothetical protein VFH14_12170, partial [Gemmatimonadaceae bacterium]|nr:hypothetical protein [Gemmatimonadaceae bacterium]
MRQPPVDPHEDSIGRELRAAIDSLPTISVPMPLHGPSPRARMSSVFSATTILAGSALVLVLALVAGQTMGERRAPLASPPPMDTAYGLIVQFGGPRVVREDAPTGVPPLAQLYPEPIHRGGAELGVVHATSPDGTRVAFWAWGASPPGLASLSLTRMALYDAAAGTIRDVLSLPNEGGAGVVWSTDGSGLLISVIANAGAAEFGAQLAHLRTIDLATGTVTSVGPTVGAQPASGGPPVRATPRPTQALGAQITMKPLLWDRGSDLIVAAVAAPNPNYASSIMVIDHGVVSSYLLEGQFLTSTLAVSPDGKTIAGARTRDFALVTWPIADYARRDEIVPAAGERILSLWWRPKSDQLYFLHDNSLTTSGGAMWSRLEVWRPGAGAPRVVDDSAGPGLLFRADGSAYLMVRPSSTAQATYDVVDANSGRVLGEITNVRVAGTLLLPGGGTPTAVKVAPPFITSTAPPVAPASLPICPSGRSPALDIDFPPPPGSVPGTGANSAEEAFRRTFPAVTDFQLYAFGKDQPEAAPAGPGPVWIVAGTDTYVAQILGDAP